MKKCILLLIVLLFLVGCANGNEGEIIEEVDQSIINDMTFKYPDAVDSSKVGTYPTLVKSGAGYFYDEVLEYRVWVHPELGGEDKYDGDDYFYSFPTYEEALNFTQNNKGTEWPLVLVLQNEHINEPSPGVFEHITEDRIAEWKPAWLEGYKREADSISKFLEEHYEN